VFYISQTEEGIEFRTREMKGCPEQQSYEDPKRCESYALRSRRISHIKSLESLGFKYRRTKTR
jgi:hypothetical protein